MNYIYTLFLILIIIYFYTVNNNCDIVSRIKEHYTEQIDIIYSYTCHEEPEGFIDTLNNLFYFNKSNIIVIIHCNDFMYEKLPMFLEKNKNRSKIKINNIHYDKQIYNYNILQSHIENFQYCLQNNIVSKYFIMLASNCIFKNPISVKDMDELYKIMPKFDFSENENPRYLDSSKNWVHWENIDKNQKINNKLYDLGVKYILSYQHEGMVIPYNIMNKVYEFMMHNNVKDLVEQQTVFEEYLLGTLVVFYLGQKILTLCKIYWNTHNMEPTSIMDIDNQEESCFKRISRRYDDKTREWLRNNNNKYESNK